MRLFLTAFLLLLPAISRAEWDTSLQATFNWHDNVTSADAATDIFAAGEFETRLSVRKSHRPVPNYTYHFSAYLLAENWPRYDGLNRLAGGINFGWQYKAGLGPYAPTFSWELEGALHQVRETDRNGRFGAARVIFQKRFTPEWTIRAQHEFTRYDGKAHAFDSKGRESTISINRQLGSLWALGVEVRYRDGGVLSYATPPRPDLLKKGKALTTVTTFDRNKDMVAYYFIAQTFTGRLSLTRELSESSALSLSTERRDTTEGAVDYLNWQTSLQFVIQF